MFGPPPFLGAGVVLSFVDSAVNAASNDPTVVVPAGAQAGDLLVLFDLGVSVNATAPETVPTDFEIGVNDEVSFVSGPVTASVRGIISAKIADGDDAGSTLTGINANSTEDKVLIVIRGSKPFVSLSFASNVGDATQGNPSAQVVDVDAGSKPLVCIGCYATGFTTPAVSPRTFTIGGSDAKDDEIQKTGSQIDMWTAYKLFGKGVSLADVTVDMDDEGPVNFLGSCIIELTV